ncbi:nucleoredoxin-like [Macrosteles quadrilineatus]|uniref:nucleoredoxin-like n=1 Tax=Macrosteles quadrilineatus TaxID=74068 RepID=UPI0023E27D6F|nr:nucleoredoxin-like [Macrosteles quadrilineatus]
MPPWVGFRQDEDNESVARLFRQSYHGVPWYTMPIEDEVKWVRLKHRCRGKVGMLVLLCAHTGKVLARDASYHLNDDPTGSCFPWIPRPAHILMNEAAQKGLIAGGLRKGPKIIPYSTLDGFIKGLYFSAHWCPPCKAFTPQLIECYRKIKARGHKFEVIFISSDRSEESFESYLSTMPWTALPYKSSYCKELASNLDVHGIPTLILLDPDGTIITEEGRSEVKEDLDGECFPWRQRPVNILTDRLAELLYDSPAVVLFVDGDEDEDLEFGEAVLLPVAEWIASRSLHLDYELLFFVAVENEASESLRSFTKLEDASPLVTAIDFPLNRFSVMEYGAEITEDSVKTFVSNFISNKLPFRPISMSESTPSA